MVEVIREKLLNNVAKRSTKMIETKQKSSRCVININTQRMKEEKKEILRKGFCQRRRVKPNKKSTYIKEYSFDTIYRNELY
jgi:hypothetical protein